MRESSDCRDKKESVSDKTGKAIYATLEAIWQTLFSENTSWYARSIIYLLAYPYKLKCILRLLGEIDFSYYSWGSQGKNAEAVCHSLLDNHGGVATHLEQEFLECEVRCVLRSITMDRDSGGDEITVELVQILKDDVVKVLHSICQQIWKTQHWPQDWRRSVFIPVSRRAMPKNVQTIVQSLSFHMIAR